MAAKLKENYFSLSRVCKKQEETGVENEDRVIRACLRQDAGTTPAQTSQSTPMSRPARPEG